MKKYIVTAFCFLFTLIGMGNELKPTNSLPWRMDRYSLEGTALEVAQCLVEEDYMELYHFLSKDWVNQLTSAISMADTEAFGIEVNIYAVLTSDYGIRYGKIALFDQIMAELRQSTFKQLDTLVGKEMTPLFKTENGSFSEVTFQFEGTGSELKVRLKKEGGNWYLKTFQIGESRFEPRELEEVKESQHGVKRRK